MDKKSFSLCRMLLFVLLLLCFAPLRLSADDLDEAYLFSKSQKLERISVKHQIAYHFQQKVVKEVTQELFISRLIHVGPLLTGIETLQGTSEYLARFCQNSKAPEKPLTDPKKAAVIRDKKDGLIAITAGEYTYTEAKAKCNALGYRLPEVYYGQESMALSAFMRKAGFELAFAGIEYDPNDWMFRYVETGLPIWQGWFHWANATDKPSSAIRVGQMVQRPRVYFFYHNYGGLRYYMNSNVPANESLFHRYWMNSPDGYVGIRLSGVICQSKWNGSGYEELYKDHYRSHQGAMKITHKMPLGNKKRDVSSYEAVFNKPEDSIYDMQLQRIDDNRLRKRETPSQYSTVRPVPKDTLVDVSSKQLVDTCESLAAQINEYHTDALGKIKDLLALVDINVERERQEGREIDRESFGRKKRMSSLISKIFFKKGTKMLWSLFGFWQQIQTDRKIKKNTKRINQVEKDVSGLAKENTAQQGEIDRNRQQILEATNILKNHSIVISQLVLANQDLSRRVAEMDIRMNQLQKEIDALKDEIEIITTLMYIDSLASRVYWAINNGYEQLADIVHSSLVGQTSPLILPLDKMAEVQRQLKLKSSSAVLDKDFAKMKSVVTTDPENEGLLLVIINAIAVGHKNLELVHLTPIPYYRGDKAYFPVLDYKYVALDQPQNSFTVLTEEEAESCVTGRCYISQMEQSMFSKSCGMPQLDDHQLDSCDVEGIPHDGMFIQTANPDGVIFSFKEEVTIQLFCKENAYIGTKRKVSGAGTMYVPPGCTLTAMDKQGRIVKVKGGPSHHLIEVGELDFADGNLLGSLYTGTFKGSEHESRRPAAEVALEQQLVVVQQSMDTAHRNVSELQKRMWITVGCFLGIVVVIVVGILLLYRYSRRFKHQLHKAIGTLSDLKTKLLDIEKLKTAIAAVTPRAARRFRPLTLSRRTDDENGYINLANQARENSQRSPREQRTYVRLPITRSVSALPATDPPVRHATFHRPGNLGVNSRLYPSCPAKGDSSDEELAEQCRSLGELSILTHPAMKKTDNKE